MYVPWTNFPFSVIKVENQDIISKFGVIGDTSKKGSLTVIDLYSAVKFNRKRVISNYLKTNASVKTNNIPLES